MRIQVFPASVPFGLIAFVLVAGAGIPASGQEDASEEPSDTGASESMRTGMPCLKPQTEKYFREILPLEEFHPGKYTEFSIKDARIALDRVLLVRKDAPALTIELVHPLAKTSEAPVFTTKNFTGILTSVSGDPAALEAFRKIGSFIKERDTGLAWSYCSGPSTGQFVADYARSNYIYFAAAGVLVILLAAVWLIKRKKGPA